MVQVPQDARRGSSVAPRRSSAVVSQELGAILGKPNGLVAEGGGGPAEVASAALAAGMAPASRSDGQAFFPELTLLTKASPTALLRAHLPAEHCCSPKSEAFKGCTLPALGRYMRQPIVYGQLSV